MLYSWWILPCLNEELFYSILYKGGGGPSSRPWVKSGGGGQCQFFWAFRPRFGLRMRGEGQSAIRHPPPGPSHWYATVFGLTVGEGYAVSVDYLIACDMIVYLIKVILTVNYYLFSGIQIKPPRSHHCSICKRWIYCIISFSSFNFFTNSWILMLRALIVTYSV